MSTLNVAVADEKKNMQSLLKGMEFLGTARSSDEAYNMIMVMPVLMWYLCM